MGQIAFRSDKYFNNKKKIDGMFGADNVCPVDLNAGLVAVKKSKWGMDEQTGEYTQENIQERFGLETPNEEGY